MSREISRRPALEADVPFLFELRLESMDPHIAAAGLVLTLGVLKVNPVKRLYERLGFVVWGESKLEFEMVWRDTHYGVLCGRGQPAGGR